MICSLGGNGFSSVALAASDLLNQLMYFLKALARFNKAAGLFTPQQALWIVVASAPEQSRCKAVTNCR